MRAPHCVSSQSFLVQKRQNRRAEKGTVLKRSMATGERDIRFLAPDCERSGRPAFQRRKEFQALNAFELSNVKTKQKVTA